MGSNLHQCQYLSAFPGQQQGNISPDRYGLLHQVTRSLRHPQPRGTDSGRWPCHQFPLPLWCTDGDAQCPGPDLRIQADASGSGATWGGGQ